MPRAQFRAQSAGVEVNANFTAPKKLTDLDAWLCSAVLALASDQVPVRVHRAKPSMVRGWTEVSRDVTTSWITFGMVDADGNRAVLIVDRAFNSLGAR